MSNPDKPTITQAQIRKALDAKGTCPYPHCGARRSTLTRFTCGTSEWERSGTCAGREIEALEKQISDYQRHNCNQIQDHCENAYVETSLWDATLQALSEVAPDHLLLKGGHPNYGVWAHLRHRVDQLTDENERLREERAKVEARLDESDALRQVERNYADNFPAGVAVSTALSPTSSEDLATIYAGVERMRDKAETAANTPCKNCGVTPTAAGCGCGYV